MGRESSEILNLHLQGLVQVATDSIDVIVASYQEVARRCVDDAGFVSPENWQIILPLITNLNAPAHSVSYLLHKAENFVSLPCVLEDFSKLETSFLYASDPSLLVAFTRFMMGVLIENNGVSPDHIDALFGKILKKQGIDGHALPDPALLYTKVMTEESWHSPSVVKGLFAIFSCNRGEPGKPATYHLAPFLKNVVCMALDGDHSLQDKRRFFQSIGNESRTEDVLNCMRAHQLPGIKVIEEIAAILSENHAALDAQRTFSGFTAKPPVHSGP